MRKEIRTEEVEPVDPKLGDREEDNQFSQEHDDQAGRTWPGMNSEIAKDEVGRFEEDEDENEPRTIRPGGTERV